MRTTYALHFGRTAAALALLLILLLVSTLALGIRSDAFQPARLTSALVSTHGPYAGYDVYSAKPGQLITVQANWTIPSIQSCPSVGAAVDFVVGASIGSINSVS